MGLHYYSGFDRMMEYSEGGSDSFCCIFSRSATSSDFSTRVLTCYNSIKTEIIVERNPNLRETDITNGQDMCREIHTGIFDNMYISPNNYIIIS